MTLTEILGCIGGGVIVSLSGILLISWFKEWIVLFIKTWRGERTSPELDLNKLESKLDNALDKETTESLNEWFDEKRFKERVVGVLRYHSIEKEEDWSRIIEERDFEELAGNLISCFEQFGKAK
jgi:hypothetical protein